MKFIKPRYADYNYPHDVRWRLSDTSPLKFYLTWTSAGVPCFSFGIDPATGDIYNLDFEALEIGQDRPATPYQIGISRCSPINPDHMRIHLNGTLTAQTRDPKKVRLLKHLVAHYWWGIRRVKHRHGGYGISCVEIHPNSWKPQDTGHPLIK